MRKAIEQFLEALRAEEFLNEEDEEWQFNDGSASGICTSSAILVAKRFGGTVLGYSSVDNPTAFIGEPDYHGHDFALINGRWLVDYWAWHVAGIVTQPILDMSSGVDGATAHKLYGPKKAWRAVDFNLTR